MPTVIKQDDPMLAAIKAELLHGVPELTGKQINTAATLALIAVKRWNELQGRNLHPIEVAQAYQKLMSGDEDFRA
jgi:hypothetical protein